MYFYTTLALIFATVSAAPVPQTGIPGIDNSPIGGVLEIVNDAPDYLLGAVTSAATNGNYGKRQSGIDNSPIGSVLQQANDAPDYLLGEVTSAATNGNYGKRQSSIDDSPIGSLVGLVGDLPDYLLGAVTSVATNGNYGKRQTGIPGVDNSPIGGVLVASGLDKVVQGVEQVVNVPAIINP